MARFQCVSHPHRGICRAIVVGGVVAHSRRCLHLQLLRRRVERCIANRGQLEPTVAWFCCSLGRVRGRTLIRVRGRRGYFPSCSTTRRSFYPLVEYNVFLCSSVICKTRRTCIVLQCVIRCCSSTLQSNDIVVTHCHSVSRILGC